MKLTPGTVFLLTNLFISGLKTIDFSDFECVIWNKTLCKDNQVELFHHSGFYYPNKN